MKKRNKLDNLQPFKPIRESALADKPLCVKIDRSIDAAIRAIPNRSEWLRNIIEEAAVKEGIFSNERCINEKDKS